MQLHNTSLNSVIYKTHLGNKLPPYGDIPSNSVCQQRVKLHFCLSHKNEINIFVNEYAGIFVIIHLSLIHICKFVL